MRRLLSYILVTLAFSLPAQAEQESVFDNYVDMRETLDSKMKKREIADVMRAFGASDEMTTEELSSLEERVRRIFPVDFENVDVLMINDMGNGWKQELYAYWGGLRYLYAYVLMHDQGNRIIAVHFQFNTDFDVLKTHF